MISVNACKSLKPQTNPCWWLKPIYLEEKESENISDANLDYFLLHNEMVKECDDNSAN